MKRFFIIQGRSARSPLIFQLQATILIQFAFRFHVSMIIWQEPRDIRLQGLSFRKIHFAGFHFRHVPILLGSTAAPGISVQLFPMNALVSVLFGKEVRSGLRLARILRIRDVAIFLLVNFDVIGVSQARGGRALLPERVGTCHRDIVEFFEQSID